MNSPDRSTSPRSLRRLVRGFGYFVQTRRDVVVIVGLGAIAFIGTMLEAAAIGLIAPTALAVVSGEPRVQQEISFLRLDATVPNLIWMIAGLLLASLVFQLGQSWIRASLTSRVEAERRRTVIAAFMAATWQRTADSAEGALQQVLDYVRHSVTGLGDLAELVKATTSFAVLVILAVMVDVRAAVGVVAVGTLLIIILLPFSLRSKRENQRLAAISMEQAQLVGEIRRTAREVTVFGARHHYLAETDKVLDAWRTHRRRASVLNNVSRPVYQYLGLFAVVVGLYLLSVLDDRQTATASVSALLLLRSISYGQNMQGKIQHLFSELPYAQRAQREVEELVGAEWTTGNRVVTSAGELVLDKVTYRYPGSSTPALRAVDLRFPFDEAVGLVGPSGGGKSTLAQVVLRLRRPQQGQVALDGVPVEELRPEGWFRLVSYVPQSPVIIRGSLADNVRVFREGISDADVEKALSRAGLTDLLHVLDGDLERRLGPRGRDLSGGQLQRLGIARALAGQPQWIVFDEPTSALDLSTEAIVQETLAALKGEVGFIVIAHRLSTLTACDRLVVLEAGQVTFDGPAVEAYAQSSFLVDARRLGTLQVGDLER